jgi:FkbM family methyltransferase
VTSSHSSGGQTPHASAMRDPTSCVQDTSDNVKPSRISMLRPTRFGELILRTILRHSNGGVKSRIIGATFRRVRRMVAKRRDLLVRYVLDGHELLMPLSHDLPLYRAAFPEYSENIGRLASYVEAKYPSLRLVDVGANVGDTVSIVRAKSQCPILCIEGDDYYFGILQHNLKAAGFKNVTVARAFVGAQSGRIGGRLVQHDGSAHLEEGGAQSVEVTRLSDLLMRYPDFKQIKMLKIDTDGCDCTILRAELELLSKRRPVLFFEFDPYLFRNHSYDGYRVFDDLCSVGYAYGIFYHNSGDYLLSANLNQNRSIVEDIQGYFSGRRGKSYVDVCLLHHDDLDLGFQIRSAELQYFNRARNSN